MDKQDKIEDTGATGLKSVPIQLDVARQAPRKLVKPGSESELTTEELVTYVGEGSAPVPC